MSNPCTYYLCVIRPIRNGPDVRDLLEDANRLNRVMHDCARDRTVADLKTNADYLAAYAAAREALRVFQDANVATYMFSSERALLDCVALVADDQAVLPDELVGFLDFAYRHGGCFAF